MKLFDVNILIYAHRSDQVHHDFYRSRLDAVLARPETCGLTTAVATGFVRIVTQPNFPNGPTPLPQALAVIETLTSSGGCQWLHLTAPARWNLFEDCLADTRGGDRSAKRLAD